MTFKLLLGLLLLFQTYCFQIRNENSGRKNIAEDDASFPLHENLRDIPNVGMFSAGNTMCLADHQCGEHNEKYSWCKTEYNSWDYCCTGKCNRKGMFYKCDIGNRYVSSYCGIPSWRTITGQQCLSSHPCGTHGADNTNSKYWCFIDEEENWEYCCNPSSSCSDKGDGYGYGCYTGIHLDSYRKKCTPEIMVLTE